MEVYIEQVVLDNFLIDFMILYLSKLILKDKSKLYRIFISCFIGTLASVFYPLVTMPNYLFIVCKLLVGVLMVILSFKINSFKIFLIKFFTFLAFTFIMGGAVYGTLTLFNSSIEIKNNGLLYKLKFPVSVILFICFCYFYLMINLVKYFNRKKHFSKFTYEVVLENNNKTITINAFLDSGNTVVDPETKEPIHIISYSTFSKMFDDITLENLIKHDLKNSTLKNPKYIKFNSLNKSSQILTFEIDELSIKAETVKVFSNIRIGLSLKNFKLNNCEMILNSFVFE